MLQQTTYFAIVNDFSPLEKPGGVLRRVESESGQTDEVFTGQDEWQPSPLLYAAERGNLDNEFVPISKEEAMRIVERIRREVAGQ